jgi:hypothetical protein
MLRRFLKLRASRRACIIYRFGLPASRAAAHAGFPHANRLLDFLKS